MARQSQRSKAEQLEIVIKLLSRGKTQAQAAAAAGVTTRTVQRWFADPQLKQRLTEVEQETEVIVKSDPVS
jgi:transposase